MDGHGIGERLARSLEGLGQRCVRVFMRGDAPTAVDREFEIDPASPNAWDDLLQQLLASDRRPRHVVHLWTLDPNSDDADANGPDNGSIDRGFYALLHMGQAIIRANVTDPVKLWLISNELHALSSCERIVPEKTMALGPCLVLPQEHANFRSCSLDVDTAALQDPDAAGLADLLVAEFLAGRGDPAILYRGRERWRQVYEPIAIGAEPQGRSPMREGGVYLILGGLGRLGLLIAEHLARTHGAKLVLTSREALPPREEWPSIIAKAAELDPAARRLAKLIELETLGAELLVRPLDMPDPRQLVLILEEATSRFGAIHGVIHAAGVQEHTPILGADRESCEHVFAPKVRGLFDLEEALRGREIDFCLLTSSLSPILGGLGFVAYSASNLLLDAFAERVRRNGAPWRSINWEGWHRTDLADAAAAPATGFGGDLTRLVMTDDEVADCFRRAVAAGERAPRLIIATGDLEQRVDQWVKLQSVPHGRKGKPVDPTGAASAPPTMRADYVAPRDEMEETIVEIARSILGIEDIGVHDHFFEMGGSSLLAVQLISAIRERYQQQLPLRALFDRPTIAGIVEVIREGLNRDEDMLEISSLLEEIETLDEEEVQRRLSEAEGVTESA
jgi:NAD(P)-dependent dehydrogenase (short-subunit alcohol dehydrogenase family)/acyl carrier protein